MYQDFETCIINGLRLTILALEQHPEVHSDDADLLALRSMLLRRVTGFEGDLVIPEEELSPAASRSQE
jgi:hypothetical protein